MLRRKRSNSPTARRKQNKLSSDKSDKACQHFWRLSQSNQSRPCRKSTSSQYFTKSIGMAWPPLMTDTIIENPWSKSIIHKIKRIILPTSPVFFKGTMDYFIQISLNLRAFRLSERKMVSISMDWFVRAKREWFVASFFLIRKVTVLDTYKIILRRSEQLWYM